MGGFGSTLGLYFEIAADPKNAQKAIDDFTKGTAASLGLNEANFNRFTAGVEKNWGLAEGSIARTGMAVQAAVKDLAYLGAGALALGTGALLLADRWAEAGTKIFEASEKTGISAAKLSGLRATTQVLGESFDSLTLTISRMGKNIEAGLRDPAGQAGQTLQSLFKSSDELRRLGLMPLDERIAEVDKRIFALNSTSKQNLALTSLAGRSYNEVRSTMAELGREGFDPLIARAKILGQFFDDESAARARQFRIELATMKTTMSGLALTIGQELVPALSQLVLVSEVKLQQGLGKNLVQAMRDAAAGLVWFMAALDPAITHTDEWKDEIDRLTLSIAGGQEETQGMTDLMARFNAMVQAVVKGTDDLGDKTAKTRAQHKAWSADLSALNSIYRELLGAQDPIVEANEKYRLTLERIATAAGPRYNATLLEKMAVEQRDSIVLKELTKDQEAADKALAQGVPMMPAFISGMVQARVAQTNLTEAQRAALPVGVAANESLTHQLLSSRMMTQEIQQQELPARRRLEIQFQRQIIIANQEIAASRREYQEHKITRAQMEADERVYSDLMVSLSEQVSAAMVRQGTVARRVFLDVSGAMLNAGINAIVYSQNVGQALLAALKATLATLAQSAAIHALEEVATGFAWLSAWPVPRPDLAAMAFASAKMWGVVAGVSLAGAIAIPSPSVGGNNAITAASPGGEIATGAAAEPKRGAAPPESPVVVNTQIGGAAAPEPHVVLNTNIYMTVQGDYMAMPQSQDHLVRVLSTAIEQRDLRFVATYVKRSPPAAR